MKKEDTKAIKVLVIDPKERMVYCYWAMPEDTAEKLLEHILGNDYVEIKSFEGGDKFYVSKSAQTDRKSLAFDFQGKDELLYGLGLLINCDQESGKLTGCHMTKDRLQTLISFYSAKDLETISAITPSNL